MQTETSLGRSKMETLAIIVASYLALGVAYWIFWAIMYMRGKAH